MLVWRSLNRFVVRITRITRIARPPNRNGVCLGCDSWRGVARRVGGSECGPLARDDRTAKLRRPGRAGDATVVPWRERRGSPPSINASRSDENPAKKFRGQDSGHITDFEARCLKRRARCPARCPPYPDQFSRHVRESYFSLSGFKAWSGLGTKRPFSRMSLPSKWIVPPP